MKQAGISLALVVMLLLGAAAPVQAQAEETGLAAEAESFYRSVLAAKDRETLQTYLDCFSDQRRVELRAELFAARHALGVRAVDPGGLERPQPHALDPLGRADGRGWIPFCSR